MRLLRNMWAVWKIAGALKTLSRIFPVVITTKHGMFFCRGNYYKYSTLKEMLQAVEDQANDTN